jgi:hypothetical protein
MGRIFSVSQDAHVLHIAGTLCLFVFSLAGLIGTGSSSSVKRQLAITLFILSLCTWLVDGWGLPPLIRSLCKVNYCQAPLRLASSWALNQSIFFFLRKLKIVLFRPRLPLCLEDFLASKALWGERPWSYRIWITPHPSVVYFNLPKKYIKIYFYSKKCWLFRLEKLIEIEFI